MQKERWRKIEEIFEQAIRLPACERQSFVRSLCCEDDELYREILALINADGAEANFLDEEVFTLGLQFLKEEDMLLKESEFAFYRLKKLLGRGGMGAVYLAHDTRLERAVALKILPVSLGANPIDVRRFRQEARTASAISHQNVAHIYEFGEADGRYYLAMEYVEGETLRELLRAGKIDARRAADIALQIAEALVATHKRGIIHRDIKPENVIVTDGGLVKVLDFGVAKLLDRRPPEPPTPEAAPISLVETTPGTVMGTIGYMSPEQLENKKVDFRADIWSLGVVLYEMLTGRKPFTGKTAEEIGEAILKKNAPSFSSAVVNRNEELRLKNIFARTLDKKAARRYESAAELALDLKELKRGLESAEQSSDKGITGATNGSDDSAATEISLNSTLLIRTRQAWSRQSLSRKVLVLAAFIALVTFSIGLSAQYFGDDPVTPNPPSAQQNRIESLAILPFDNETGDPKLDFLAKGLAEDLIRNLGQADAFPVISFSSAQKIKARNPDYAGIKQSLRVKSLLEGVIKTENGALLVETRLVDLSGSRLVWQERLSIPNGDLLKLRNAVTLMLSGRLQEGGGSDGKKLNFAEYPTASSEAYQLYLEARFGRRETTVKEVKGLIKTLEKAVALDPKYTLALVALAENYNILGTFLGQSPEFYQPKAEKTLQRALALDDSLSEAHTLLGKIKMDYEHDWAGCERAFRHAIEINPNNELAHHWYGEVYLSAMNRLDEAIAELEISHRLNPLSSGILTGLAWCYIGKGDYRKAIELCDRAHETNPNDNDVFHYRAQALFKLGRFDDAVSEMDKAIEADREATRYAALKAVFLAAGGRREAAAEILKELEAKRASKYSLAIVENALGNRDRAFELLNEELETQSVDLLSIKIDPLLDTLRDDARFNELERKLNLPD